MDYPLTVGRFMTLLRTCDPPSVPVLARLLVALRGDPPRQDPPIYQELCTARLWTSHTDTRERPMPDQQPAAEPAATFAHDDGSTYTRADPAEFDVFDHVDSTTINDDGVPN